jgi:hypothetical protein
MSTSSGGTTGGLELAVIELAKAGFLQPGRRASPFNQIS